MFDSAVILDDTSIVLNDLILLRSRAGIATATEQLLLNFPEVEHELRLVRFSELLFAAPLRGLPRRESTKTSSATFDAKSPPEGHASSDGSVKTWLKTRALSAVRDYTRFFLDPVYKPIVFHEPDMLALPMGRKIIATINDMSVLLFPHWHPEHRVISYRKNFVKVVQRANRFLAISETSKQDFVRITGIDPRRVEVALLAPRPEFRPQSASVLESVRRRVGPRKYFLFLSTLEPRKNVLGLLDAWATTSKSFRDEHELILAGGWGWKSETLASRLRDPQTASSVRWLGQVSDADIVPLVAGAEALVYPSFYEGFGLPPLEAMACGTPVISSDRGALREAIGDAAWIINPENVPQIAEAIQQITKESAAWRQRGLDHAAKYSWKEYAAKVALLYRHTIADTF